MLPGLLLQRLNAHHSGARHVRDTEALLDPVRSQGTVHGFCERCSAGAHENERSQVTHVFYRSHDPLST